MTDPFEINKGAFLNTSTQDTDRLSGFVEKNIFDSQKDKIGEPEEVEDPNDKSYGTLGLSLDDSLNPFKVIDGYDWLNNSDTRGEQVDKSISTMRDGLMKDGAKVPAIVNGKVEMVDANGGGRLTAAGMHAFDNAMQILSFAEKDENGGYRVNPMTKQTAPVFGSKLMTPYDAEASRNQKTQGVKDVEIGDTSYQVQSITPDEIGSEKHVKSLISAYKTVLGKDVLKSDEPFTVNDLLDFRERIKKGGAALSANTADVITQVEDTKDVEITPDTLQQMAASLGRLKAEANMSEDKLVDLYNGQPIFNYAAIQDLNEFESQFSQLDLPKADKARFLASFRTNFESTAGDLMQQAAEGGKVWDYAANFLGSFTAIPNALGADIGFNNEDAYLKGMEEGRSFYDMAKSGVINVDRGALQRMFEKTALSTLSSFQNTGTGAGFLALKGLGSLAGIVSEDAEKAFDRGAGYMAEAAAITGEAKRQYYKNIGSDEFKVLGTTISSDDIYDLVGNILETVSTGGASAFVKGGVKTGAKVSLKTAQEIGKASAQKIAAEAAEAGVKRSAIRNAASSLKEQAKSLWLNSAAVNKAESVLATSLHGSFTSAGGAVADGITKGLDKAAAQNLTGDAAMEYASNEATGYALVNGVATFAMMTAMNSIAPGIEKALMSPEGGLSAIQAIKNSIASRANRQSISKLIKDVITDEGTRKTIVKGVADEISGYVNKNGIGKFMGGVTAGTATEFLEEAGDTALALAGEAYLLQDKDSRKLLEQSGYWTEVLKAGLLGALGGAGAGVLQTTSKENKQGIKLATDAMNSYKQTLPQQLRDNMREMVQIQGKQGQELGRIDQLQNILNTGSVSEKVDALANIGSNIVKEITPSAAVSTQTSTTPEQQLPTASPVAEAQDPEIAITSKQARVDEINSRLAEIEASDKGPRDQVKPDGTGSTPLRAITTEERNLISERDQLSSEIDQLKQGSQKATQLPQQEKKEAKPASKVTLPVKSFSVGGAQGASTSVKVPVEKTAELAEYGYKEAHGKQIEKGKLEVSKNVDIKYTLKGATKVNNIEVTTYLIDGQPADLHSFNHNNRTIFSTKAELQSKIESALRNSKVIANSINSQISDTNEFVSVAKDIAPEEAPEVKPKAEKQEEQAQKKDESKPKAETPKETKPKEESTAKPVATSQVKGVEILSSSFAGIVKRFEKAFKSLGVTVVFYNSQTVSSYPELVASDVDQRAFYRFTNNVIAINTDKIKTQALFTKAIKHEFLHAVEGKFRNTAKGLALAEKAASEIANNPELAEWMKKEYSKDWDKLSNLNKLSEVVRAFIGGDVNKDTFGLSSFQKYIKAFLDFAKRFTKANSEFEKYRQELESEYKKIIKENAKEFGIKTSFTEALSNFISSIKGNGFSQAKKKQKVEAQSIFTSNVDDDVIQQVFDDVTRSINSYMVENEAPSLGGILTEIEETIDGFFVGVNTKLSRESKLKVYDKVIAEWNETDPKVAEAIQTYRNNLDQDSGMVLFGDIDEDTEAGQAVIESAKVSGWANVSKFIRAANVNDDIAVKVEGKRPIDDAPDGDGLFTNASITFEKNKDGEFPDIGLSFLDVVKVVDDNGVFESVMLYVRTDTVVMGDTEVQVHRFMKGVAAVKGRPTPFMKLRQAAYEREFHEEVKNSNFSLSIDSNGSAFISNPEELVRTVFKSLLGGRDFITQGDKQINFNDMFRFIDDAGAKSISPFYFTEGKVVVNTAKLRTNFNFIKGDMLKGEQAKTTAMLVAASVRAAIEEELLHFATVGTFKPEELIAFTDDLIKNQNFNEIVRQIKVMQGVETENDQLNDKEKMLIAVETLSFLNQKASEGAVYGDHYNELFERSLGGDSVIVARQFAQRMKYLLGARAVTSYMSPKMQNIVARFSLAKKEIGITRRQTNISTLANKYSEEQYRLSRAQLDKVINDAFVQNATEIAELREELRDINIPAKNIIVFNWDEQKIELNENFREFYANRRGQEALDALEQYFSQLNDNEALREFTTSVRNAQERMMNYRNALDISNEANQAVVLASDGDFQGLLNLIESKKNEAGWLDPNALLQILESFESASPSENEQAKVDSIRILKQMPQSEFPIAAPYIQYAQSVNDYNEMVTDYAEVLLNKNINKLDEFGREFEQLSSLLEKPLPFEPNMFGFENQTPEEAVEVRKRKDVVEKKMASTPDAIQNQPEWQKGFRGRSITKDRKENPSKVVTIENNAAYLGETEYNNLLLAKLKGAVPTMAGFDYSFDQYYQTMGFVLPSKENLKNSDEVVYTLLKDHLFKHKLPHDFEVVIGKDLNGNEIKSKLIGIADKMKGVKTNATKRSIAKQVSEALVGDGQLMEWFNSLEALIGFDRSRRSVDPETALGVVQSLNGRESFAYRFAKQMLFRMYNNNITQGDGRNERTLDASKENVNEREYSLFDNIQDLQDLLMYSNQAKYGQVEGMDDSKMIAILGRLPEILESINAINHDIGLARKAFSRFRSEFLRQTILGDIRLIQEQNAEGIRANRELAEQIKKSFFDIQALDDIQWQIDYLEKGGIVGVEGFSALDLMDRLASIPSSASKEYFINYTGNAKTASLVDRYWALKEFFENPMMQVDGKSVADTHNYVFNTIEKVEDRPDENDENYTQDRPARPGMADETINRMREGSEQTQEQLEATRRKELFEEFKKINSWMTNAGIAVFQTFEDSSEVYSHEIDVSKVRRFFDVFAQVMAFEEHTANRPYETAVGRYGPELSRDNEARTRLNNMMAEQLQMWINKYGPDGLSPIFAKIPKYNHPIQFLEDVVSEIAIKERNYVTMQQAQSDTLGGIAMTYLQQNVNEGETKAKKINAQIKRYNKIASEVDDLRSKIEANNAIGTEASLRKAGLLQQQLNKKTSLLSRADFGESYNHRASRAILDSLREDVDKGKLTTGTLFHARTYDFGSANSKIENSLFMKSPMFSLLLQAMPNLIIYQPNETYTGKKHIIQSNLEFASLPNGDHILYIGNSDGVSSAKQSQILQQLMISLIDGELGVVAGNFNKAAKAKSSKLASRIQDVAENIRTQAQAAFESTPERIAFMVEQAANGLAKTSIDAAHHQAILAKYKEALEIDASNKIGMLKFKDVRHKYVDTIFGRESPEAKAIMDELLAPDLKTGETSIIADIALVADVLSNPDAYRLLNSIGGSDANLISFKLSPLRQEAMNKAIAMFSSGEVKSQEVFEIQLNRFDQAPSDFDPNEPTERNESDMLATIYGASENDFYSAFEETFNTGVAKESKSARSFDKIAKAIQALPPSKIKPAIDSMLLIQNVNAEKEVGNQLNYDQVSQAKGAMEAFYETPDHMYRYILSEIIGTLDVIAPKDSDIQTTSIFSEDYPANLVSPQSTYQLLKIENDSGLFVKPMLAPVMTEGNLMSYYYNKAPTTDIFERRRIDKFINAMLSGTEAGQAIINRTFDAANKAKNVTIQSYDAADFDEDTGYENIVLVRQLRNGLAKLIGNNILNEASENIQRINATKKANIEDARNRLNAIAAEIEQLQATGKEEILKYILEQNKALHSKTTASLLATADSITAMIQDFASQRESYSYQINRAGGTKAKEMLGNYQKYLTKISKIDSEIERLLEDRERLAAYPDEFNKTLKSLLDSRNSAARVSNGNLQGYGIKLAQAISKVIEKGDGYLEVSDRLAEFIENKFNPLALSIIDYRPLNGDNIDEFIAETKAFADRGFISGRNKAAYARIFKEVRSNDFINQLVIEYRENADVQAAIENQIRDLENQFGSKSPFVLAYKRLKSSKRQEIARSLTKAVSGQTNPNFIRNKVIEHLVRNEALLFELRDEVVFSDLASAFDSGAELDAEDVMENQNMANIGVEFVARRIEQLMDESEGVQRALDSMLYGNDLTTRRLLTLQKEFRFSDKETEQRLLNQASPTHQVLIDIVLDEERKKTDPKYAASFDEALNAFNTIKEAMRLFIEKEGREMYRHINEEIDVFADAFDIRQNIDNVLDIARLRGQLTEDMETLANENIDTALNQADEKAVQLFGISVRDMDAMNYSPAVVKVDKTDDTKKQILKIKNDARRGNLRQRLRSLALFINDAHSKSLFLPTNETEKNTETSYIVYSRDAKTELAQLKRREGGSWSVDERLNEIIFNAATIPPLMPKQPLRTLDKKTLAIELDKEINDDLAIAAGITTKVTVREFLNTIKGNQLDYFLKQGVNKERSAFAKGLGIVSVMKEFDRMTDSEINDFFSSIHSFASDANNKGILQTSGMQFLKKQKDQYSPSEVRAITKKAYEILVGENEFLNPLSLQSHALMMNEAQMQDILTMLHSDNFAKKRNNYEAVAKKATSSMATLYMLPKLAQNAGFSLSEAVYKADISHNYSSMFSAIYGRGILEKLIAGVYNATKTDSALYSLTYHQNALMRGKFRGNHGAYLEALSLVGMIDHGINGASGKNRYTSEYQDFQDRIGRASKKLNNNFMNGAKAYIIASLKGIAEAEVRDASSGEKPGYKAWQWATSFVNGVEDHKNLLKNKKKLGKVSNIGIKVLNKLYNKSYKQDKEAQAVVDIYEIIKRDLNTLASPLNGPLGKPQTASGESFQQVLINKMIRDLEQGMTDSELDAVNEYSSALLEEFGAITDAHRMANMFASKDLRTETGGENQELSSNDVFAPVYRTSYSTVPLRFSYARNPLDTTSTNVDQEKIDIDEFISFERSSLNFKNTSRKERKALRPIDLNPFTAPDSLANDALYRTYMAPTYNVIRKLMGRIVHKSNGEMITEGGMLKEIGVYEQFYSSKQNYEYISAYIMNTVEKQIRNDMPQDLIENSFNNAIKFSTILVLAKQLISVWQPILNGVIPAASKGLNLVLGKMLGYSDKDISRYAEAMWLALKDDQNLKKFVKENSVTSYKHRAEGANVRETQIRYAQYHKENKLKYGTRYLMSKTNSISEKFLDLLIGGPERVMVKAIYAFELHNRLKEDMENAPATIEEMLKLNPDEISTLSKTRADMMVTDFMGLGDKSKKAGIYNADKRTPLVSLILNGFVRHGNHSATVNANRAMYAEMFISKAFGKYDNLDRETINEGVENIAGTMIQNSLFFAFRAAALTQLAAYVASMLVEAFGDEDDEEDIAERAARWTDSLTQWNDDSSWMWNVLKEQLFPSYMIVNDPKFSEDGYNSAYVNLVKDIGQDVAWDAVGITPGTTGTFFSFGPSQALIKSMVQGTTEVFTGNAQEDWYEMKDAARDAERINPVQSVLQEPFSTAINMAALLQNRFTPKEGLDGIDNKELIYGLINQIGGTREARGRTPKRHAEQGGWGYKNLKDKGFTQYWGFQKDFEDSY